MKETKYSPYNKLVFRETFNDETAVRNNGGSPTDVTFSNGVASFDGLTSYIKYPHSYKGTYTIRIKYKDFVWKYNNFLMDMRGDSGVGYIVCGSDNYISPTSGTVYINSVKTAISTNGEQDIFISGIALDITSIYLNSRYTISNMLDVDIELFEIYQGALTASEVKNLSNNTWNKEQNFSGEPKSAVSGVAGENIDLTESFTTNGSGLIINTDNFISTSDATGIKTTILNEGKKYKLIIKGTTDVDDFQLRTATGGDTFYTTTNGIIDFDGTFIATSSELLYLRVGEAITATTTLTTFLLQELNPKTLIDFDSTNGVLEDKCVGNTVEDVYSFGGFISDSWIPRTGGFIDSETSISGIGVYKIGGGVSFEEGKKYRVQIISDDYTNLSAVESTAGAIYWEGSNINYNFDNFIITRTSTGGTLGMVLKLTGVFIVKDILIQEIRSELEATDVVVKKQGALFNGSTSKIDTGTDMIGTKAVTIMFWYNPYSQGETSAGRIIDNGNCFIRDTANPSPYILLTSNNGVNNTVSGLVIKYSQMNFLVVTRESDGAATWYYGDKNKSPAITMTGNSGTPVDGSTNIIIGNNVDATQTQDGLIPKLKIVEGILDIDEITQYRSETRKELI